jgi:hypothetical protein
MEVIQRFLDLLNSIPAEAWSVIMQTVVAAAIVSPVGLAIKKWLSIDSEKKMLTLIMLSSLLAGALQYLHSVPQFAPWFAIVQGWLIFATTQPVYRFAVKPLAVRLGVWWNEQLIKATATNEAKAATVPPQGLPVKSTPQPFEDFSH